ncbi:MAG TPA: DnaA N-terminal domain-containing protein [Anaerolineaceae bacterium]
MDDVAQEHAVRITLPDTGGIWSGVTGQLREEISKAFYESWVEPLVPVRLEGAVFVVAARNSYSRDLVESRLKARIQQLLSSSLGKEIRLQIVVGSGQKSNSGSLLVENEISLANPGLAPRKEGREDALSDGRSSRKISLQKAYGTERARIIQPERGMYVTHYMFNNWLPLLGHSAFAIILATRSLCFWNPLTGELRNVVDTEMGEIAKRAAVSVRTVKSELNHPLVKKYFLRYKVRRVITSNGVRTAGITIMVRMDDPLTPEDQERANLPESERWYPADYEDESDE